MGNRSSRTQVIEIKKVEIVRKPQEDRERHPPKRKPEDDSGKKKTQKPQEDRDRPPLRRRLDDDRVKKKDQKDKDDSDKKKDQNDKDDSDKKKDQKVKDYSDKKKDQKDKDFRKPPEKEPLEKAKDKTKKKKKKPPPTPPSPPDQGIKPEAIKEPELKAERYESVSETATNTSDIPKKENIIKKIIRLIGIPEMSPKNFVIMFILWSMRFFIPWINTWWDFNKHILSDPAHLKALESYLFMHEIIAFIILSFLCVMFSIFADVFNLKYFLYLFLLALFLLCPITGLVAINILWARGYDRPQYHKYSPTTYVSMYWVKSIAFIAYPLEFGCFFTQVDDMSREAHYNYAAVFVFLDSLNWLICFYVIPGECPTLQWTLASVWIAIGVVIHTVFLLSCFFILWVKPANKVLNRSPFVLKVVRLINRSLTKLKMKACLIDETPRKIKLDNFNEKATPFMKKMKLILFGLILVPIIFSSFVIAIMHRLELDEHWDKHEFLGASSMFIFGRVIGVILVAAILFLLRRNKKIKFLNKFSFTRPDVLALGLPHIILILALVVIAGRFGSLHSLKEGDIIVGPVPDDDGSVIEFYNADFRNRTVCVYSEKFRPVKVGPRHRETRKPSDPGVTKYEITVTLAPRTTPPVLTHEILEYAKNSLITYVITLNSSEATANDLEALYTRFQLNRVSGTESVKPKKQPQLIIINSFMLNTSSYFIHVTQFQANFSHRIEVPPKQRAHVMDLVAGRIDIRYENEGTNNTQAPSQPILTHMDVRNYTIWAIVLGLATAHNASNETEPYNVLLNQYLIMEVAGPDSNPLPNKRQLQQDVSIMMGMCLGGIAEAGIRVGFIYLFWLDTPIGELRTTTLAGFAIALAIPLEFPRLKLIDISTGVAMFLLCLQIMFTAAHFIGAVFLYDQTFNFRKRND